MKVFGFLLQTPSMSTLAKHQFPWMGLVMFALLGCPHDDDHAHPGEALATTPGEHDNHGGHDEIPTEAITIWGEKTQAFVEFPLLVVGEESRFAAHLTQLEDHLAIGVGTVTVELSGGDKPTERFSVSEPSSPGIFRPVVKPAHSGVRTVTLQLESQTVSETHTMGELTVFAGVKEARDAEPEAHESDPQISYLLEQQWYVPFRVAPTATRPVRSTMPVFGELSRPADAEFYVVAPRAGRLTATPDVVAGSAVESGAPLCTLSGISTEGADVVTFDLAVEQAGIRVNAAKREVERLRPLVGQGVVPAKRLVDAQTTLAEFQADLDAARRRKTQMEQSQLVDGSTSGFVVAAPMAGIVAETQMVSGSWVQPGDPLVRIVDPKRLWLDVQVPENYASRLQNVSGVLFRTDKQNEWVELGRESLVYVGTDIDPKTRTLLVRFRPNPQQESLVAGMFVEARIIIDAPRTSLVVPAAALVDDAGVNVVYVQTGGETFVRRAIRLGIRDGDWVEVLSGLEAGEWIVVRGAYSVRLASLSTTSVGHGHAH